jgi:hypothetical protein
MAVGLMICQAALPADVAELQRLVRTLQQERKVCICRGLADGLRI